jgi:hexosaminidase
MKRLVRPRRPLIGLLTAALLATPLVVGSSAAAGAPPAPALIPKPVSQTALHGQTFTLQSWSTVGVITNSKERRAAHRVADQLTAQLRRSTGYPLPVKPGPGAITLSTNGPSSLGAEGYQLRADRSGVAVTAATPEGLFRGVTTLRQLLPAKADAGTRQAGPWLMAGTRISDSRR